MASWLGLGRLVRDGITRIRSAVAQHGSAVLRHTMDAMIKTWCGPGCSAARSSMTLVAAELWSVGSWVSPRRLSVSGTDDLG